MKKVAKVDGTVFEGTFYKVSERPVPFRVEFIDASSLTASINSTTGASMLVDVDTRRCWSEETDKKKE